MSSTAPITVLVIGTLPPPIGGAGVSLQQLVGALRGRNDIRVIMVNTGGVRRHPIVGPFRFLAIAWRVFWGACRADVVSLQPVPTGLPFMGPIAWTSARLWRKPFMIRMFGGQNYLELTGLGGAMARWFIRRCDLYLAETKAATAAAQGDGLRRAAWYATGRPMKKLPSVEGSSDRPCRRFVFLSQVKLSKGVGTLVEAADLMNEDVEIDVYGPFFEGIDEKFIDGHRHVRYRGVIPPDEVTGVLSRYDALVFPTHWPGEGYPGIIMEAYGAGLPVIASRWLAIPEIVDESCGILIEPQNPAALAEAMTRLVKDPALFTRLREGAISKRSFFDADRWVDYFVTLCNELARKR